MGDFCQRQLSATSEAQLPDLCPHGFQRRGADGWGKSAEQRVVPRVASPPRPKTVSEKVKLDVRILTFALSVLAVDDPGLRRVHFEMARPPLSFTQLYDTFFMSCCCPPFFPCLSAAHSTSRPRRRSASPCPQPW